jgi:hypothetical protein
MLQRRFVGAQKLQLMLGEVAELDAFREADLAAAAAGVRRPAA